MSICESTYFAKPKSVILNTPSCIIILAGLISLCIIPIFNNALIPDSKSLNIFNASSSETNLKYNLMIYFLFLRNSLKSPPLQYSVIMYVLFTLYKTSINLTILVSSINFIISISDAIN